MGIMSMRGFRVPLHPLVPDVVWGCLCVPCSVGLMFFRCRGLYFIYSQALTKTITMYGQCSSEWSPRKPNVVLFWGYCSPKFPLYFPMEWMTWIVVSHGVIIINATTEISARHFSRSRGSASSIWVSSHFIVALIHKLYLLAIPVTSYNKVPMVLG